MKVKNIILCLCFMFIVYPIPAFSRDWTLQVVPPGTEQFKLNAMWGSSGSDIFAVGAQGCILHYDGSTWTTWTLPEGSDHSAIIDVWSYIKI